MAALSSSDLAHIEQHFRANLVGAVNDHPNAPVVDVEPLIKKALDYVKSDYVAHPEEYEDVQHQEDDYFREILNEALGSSFGLPEEYFE